MRLEKIERSLSGCTRCGLCEQRTADGALTVFGEGNPHAEVMVIGEAPGENESRAGRPFVGMAGSVLEGMLREVGLSRGDVYIANVVKCRPPSNRDPRKDEVAACSPFLDMQVDAVSPSVAVTLGNFATRHALMTGEGIASLHGKLRESPRWPGVFVFPCFHPSALHYNRDWKRWFEEDIVTLRGIVRDGFVR